MPLSEEERAQAAHEHDAACGAAIKAWTQIESALVFYFQAAAQIQDQFRARMIWASLPNWNGRRKMLLQFSENYIADEQVLRRFRILMKRVSKMAAKRNLIAHTSHGIDGTGKALFLQFDYGEEEGVFLFLKQIRYDTENVKNWASDMNTLWRDLIFYLDTFSQAIHTSSRMHREWQDDRDRNNGHPPESTPEES